MLDQIPPEVVFAARKTLSGKTLSFGSFEESQNESTQSCFVAFVPILVVCGQGSQTQHLT